MKKKERKLIKKLRRENKEARGGGGCVCVVCDQHCQKYDRPIYRGMVRVLSYCLKRYNFNDFHMESTQREMIIELPDFKRCGDATKLVLWGMLEKASGVGMYRVTNYGKEFVEGRAEAPKYVTVYNDGKIGSSLETTSARDAVGVVFKGIRRRDEVAYN